MTDEISIHAVSPEFSVGVAVCASAGALPARSNPKPAGTAKIDRLRIEYVFLLITLPP
jgi:hypothetical protein